MNVTEIFSYTVSVLGIVVAIWQTIKNYNLKKYIKAESMSAYANAGIILGSAQACLAGIKSGDINKGIHEAGRVEGIAQTLLMKTIKDVFNNYNYNRKDIEDWVNSGKIHDFHKEAFMKYADK